MKQAFVLLASALLVLGQGLAAARAGLSTEVRREGVRVDMCWDGKGLYQQQPDGTCGNESQPPAAETPVSKEVAAKLLQMFPQMRLACPDGYELLTTRTGSPACGRDLVDPVQFSTTDVKEATP